MNWQSSPSPHLHTATGDKSSERPARINVSTYQLINVSTYQPINSHIAAIYAWYPATLQQPYLDFSTFEYQREDMSRIANIVAKFEENYALALAGFDGLTDATWNEKWKMVSGEKVLLPEMPRLQVARGFLFNHLYHHRGEMIVYLRATGNKVPGLYGPTREDRPA